MTEIEAKIVGLLQRYDALQFEELKSVVFEDGTFSYARERELEGALVRLVERGALRAPGQFGPFQLTRAVPGPISQPRSSAASGRQAAPARLRGHRG
jgi:hypothetical protein